MPPDMGVDPDRVATYMAKVLQDRADEDLAIRMTLKPDVLKIIFFTLLSAVFIGLCMHPEH